MLPGLTKSEALVMDISFAAALTAFWDDNFANFFSPLKGKYTFLCLQIMDMVAVGWNRAWRIKLLTWKSSRAEH